MSSGGLLVDHLKEIESKPIQDITTKDVHVLIQSGSSAIKYHRPTNKTSEVWKVFSEIKIGETTSFFVACMKCMEKGIHKIYKADGTSNMKKHLLMHANKGDENMKESPSEQSSTMLDDSGTIGEGESRRATDSISTNDFEMNGANTNGTAASMSTSTPYHIVPVQVHNFDSQQLIFMDTDSNVNSQVDNSYTMNAVRFDKVKIGFVGAGNIALAIARGLTTSGSVQSGQIFASAPSDNNLVHFKSLGCHTSNFNEDLFVENIKGVKHSETQFILFICIKPSIFKKHGTSFWRFLWNHTFMHAIGDRPLMIVSVMAGVPLAKLRDVILDSQRTHALGSSVYTYQLARIMPNTACSVGHGAIGLSFLETMPGNAQQRELISLLNQLGYCQVVNEDQLDGICGLAGSGIAFAYTMIQSMADGGVLAGLPRNTAVNFALQAMAGAAEMVRKSGVNPIELRDQVCSPGGTTIRGVHQLEKGSFNHTVMNAVEAAANRCKEFSQMMAD